MRYILKYRACLTIFVGQANIDNYFIIVLAVESRLPLRGWQEQAAVVLLFLLSCIMIFFDH